jgi:hypothetical protein
MKVTFISGGALKSVQRISVVRPNSSGAAVRHVFVRANEDPDDVLKVTLVRPGLGAVKRLRLEMVSSGRKKQSSFLRPAERAVRKLAIREINIASDYLARHSRSNRKKANGWVKDLPRNVSRAFRTDGE